MKKTVPPPARAPGIPFIERFDSVAPWKRALTLAAILVLVICALMPDIVFHNKIFLVPDAQAPLSFAAVGEKALAAGTYPLWNPYLFCGMPSYASLAFTPHVYPPAFVTYVLQQYLRFPEMTWLLLHYILAGVGVYLLARALGARASVSVLAGVAFMIMPNYIAIGANGHGSQACSIAYMPYALLLAWHIMRGNKRLTMAALLAIVLGFQMLRGHIQIAYYTYLLVGLLFVFETVRRVRAGEAREAGKSLAYLAASVVCALGIAAVLILPVRAYAPYSIRGGGGTGGLGYDYATGWSLHPKEMLTFVFPWAFGYGKATYWGSMPFTDYPNYVGLVTAVFALFAACVVKGRVKWFLVVAAVFSTVLSFGKYFPVLYGPMFRLFPLFNKFRVPVMVLIVQQLALVALAAVGIESFLERCREGSLPRWLDPARLRWALTAIVVLFVLVLLMGDGIREGVRESGAVAAKVDGSWREAAAASFANDLARTVILAAAICFIVFLGASRRLAANTLVLALGIMAVVDLGTVDRNILHPEKGWPGAQPIQADRDVRDEILKPDEPTKILMNDSTYFRLFPAPAARIGQWSHNVQPFSENRFMAFGISSLGGYHAAKIKAYQDVMDAMFASFNEGRFPAAIVNMLNAKYFYSYYPLFGENAPFPLVWSSQDAYLYENPFALPRAFCVGAYRVLPKGEALAALRSPGFDPSREVIVQEEPSIRPESAEGSVARITEYGLNSMTIAAHAEKPCMLVVSEIAYPDWKAEVDGAETPVLTANYCLRAIPLAPGEHAIRFHFSSRVLRISLLVSIVSLAAAAVVPAVRGIVAARGR